LGGAPRVAAGRRERSCGLGEAPLAAFAQQRRLGLRRGGYASHFNERRRSGLEPLEERREA
jgi:hypothetical protein